MEARIVNITVYFWCCTIGLKIIHTELFILASTFKVGAAIYGWSDVGAVPSVGLELSGALVVEQLFHLVDHGKDFRYLLADTPLGVRWTLDVLTYLRGQERVRPLDAAAQNQSAARMKEKVKII